MAGAQAIGPNPLQQDLLLKMVMRYVDSTELLKLRLTSKRWNRLAVEILEKRRYAVELNCHRMHQYKQLLWESKLSRIQNNSEEIENLRLALKIHHNHSIAGELDELSNAIHLMTLFPSVRVEMIKIFDANVELDMDEDDGPNSNVLLSRKFFTLIQMCSKTLHILEIFGSIGKLEEFDIAAYDSIDFPKLSILEYHYVNPDNGEPSMTEHIVRIIQHSRISKLTLELCEGTDASTLIYNQSIFANCASNLHDLTIIFDETSSITSVVSNLNFPKLQSLDLQRFRSKFLNDDLKTFLTLNCSKLQKLRIEWAVGEDMGSENWGIEFPFLPNVLQFEFYCNYYNSGTRLQNFCRAFNRLIGKIPSVQSFSSNFELCFVLANAYEQLVDPVPIEEYFPVWHNIGELTMKMSLARGVAMFDVEALAKKIYHKMFPSARKLSIIPKDSAGDIGEAMARTFRDGISFLLSHPKILEVVLVNYQQRWLEEVNGNIIETGMKSLKMFPSQHGADPGVDVAKILSEFPELRRVQYGKTVFSIGHIVG